MSPAQFVTLLILITVDFGVRGDESNSTTKGFFDYFFSPCKCRCGVPNREARLSAGEHIRSHEFPWLATIQHGGKAIPATLINNRYVITSATLLAGLTPYDIKVTLGQYDRCTSDVSSSNVSVDKIHVHPDFAPTTGAHDVALVRLTAPVQVERRVAPVCLPVPGRKYTGLVATALGWTDGAPSSDNNATYRSECRPRKVGLPVLEHDICLGTPEESTIFTEDKGCAGIVGAKSPVCREDAGGPMMYRSRSGIYELLGVLSAINDCKNPASPTFYVKLNEHLTWITKTTTDACYCFKT